MSKFNTVTEVTHWKAFTHSGLTYDLSHLNAHHVKYQDSHDSKDIIYRFIVTYGMHCFTRGIEGNLSPDQQSLMYYGPKENRPFDFKRYDLSKRLPAVIEALGNPGTLVIHAPYGKYATFKLLVLDGGEMTYFVPFVAFREKKKLRLHIQSAYPKEQPLGKIQKVNFFAIAKNLFRGKKPPHPRK